ncbi:AraC family transcriptional regulator [Sphingobium sp.]|uniref:AraC family transcriptional regulator n=1 Tax=Sphingobium sp. TaxID=1912891 RepID=UPI0028BEA534|nr:AraC family transcriptional regulator ligand-binding domain-containing protein [Sphingobium sp.]
MIASLPGARITLRSLELLIVGLIRATGDELWLICSRPVKPGSFRFLCNALVHCDSLRDAIREAGRFLSLVMDDLRLSLHVEGDAACLALNDLSGPSSQKPQLHGTILLFAYGILCWLSQKSIPLKGLHYSFEQNFFSGELAKVYRSPIKYNEARSELVFPRDILQWSVVPDVADARKFLSAVPGILLIRYLDEITISDRVRNILKRNVKYHLSLETVAAMLATSPQTLRRRLKDDGVSGFQQLKDDVRRDFAFEALAKSNLSLEEIAASLGFAEASAFHRAFRRWSDLTPGHYRFEHGATGVHH